MAPVYSLIHIVLQTKEEEKVHQWPMLFSWCTSNEKGIAFYNKPSTKYGMLHEEPLAKVIQLFSGSILGLLQSIDKRREDL